MSINMRAKREKNISIFNKDVQTNSGYIYTCDNLYSARIATRKQTIELVKLILRHFPKKLTIVDIGCGDGKHTLELLSALPQSSIVGIDPAEDAIKLAKKRIQKKGGKKISFIVGNIYDVDKLFKTKSFDLAIIRGVLHHLYEPIFAIKKISRVFPNVIIVEANGYNPILKVIERVSPYHREHEEKSYWPPLLSEWFRKQGYKLMSEKYAGIVPYFCPTTLAKALKLLEPLFENIPILNRLYCACNYIFYKK